MAAIYQISKIETRKGLQIDLPSLSGGEMGWSSDTRQLWIGNGTLQEGAPVIGNTEILTEFSDLLALPSAYTYKGESAGYIAQTGASTNSPIKLDLQTWMDQWVSVKDFGAKGDGITDDTSAINRAMYQLYCRNINPQVRRRLYFPAGLYIVSDSIRVPPYASLYGEGIHSSIIQLTATSPATCVARTADTALNIGTNIGAGIFPTSITISNMCFQAIGDNQNIFSVDLANGVKFTGVSFLGALGEASLMTNFNDTAGIRFLSTPAITTTDVQITNCEFSGTVWGINTASRNGGVEQLVKGLTINQSVFNMLFQGVVSGTETMINDGAIGIKICNSTFDNIYAQGVLFRAVQMNSTSHNIFYDVGNYFLGLTNPSVPNIEFGSDNNVAFGDVFQRTDDFSTTPNPGITYPRVVIGQTNSIASTNSAQIALGGYIRETGRTATLLNNTFAPTVITSTTGLSLQINTNDNKAFKVDYSIVRGTAVRTGCIMVATGTTDMVYDDNYIETQVTGITITVSQVSNIVSVLYTSTNIGTNATMTYSINRLG